MMKPLLFCLGLMLLLQQQVSAQVNIIMVRPRIPMWVVVPAAYDITAYLKNGRIVEGRSALEVDHFNETMRIRLKRKNYYPRDTDSIFANGIKGIPLGSRWIFSILEGPVTAYKNIPRRKAGEFKYLQKEEDEIVPYTMENLGYMLADNKEASDLLRTKTRGGALGKSLMLAGAAAFITGLVLSADDDHSYEDLYGYTPEPKYDRLPEFLIAGGAGGFLAGYLTLAFTFDFDIKAIRAYNRQADH